MSKRENIKDKLFEKMSGSINIDSERNNDDDDGCEPFVMDESFVDISFGEDVKFHYNVDRFKDGIKDISYYTGKIAALMSIGVSPDVAVNFIDDLEVTRIASESSIKVAELNSKLSLDAQKKQSIEDKKNMI